MNAALGNYVNDNPLNLGNSMNADRTSEQAHRLRVRKLVQHLGPITYGAMVPPWTLSGS